MGRRDARIRSTQATPVTDESEAAFGARTERANGPIRDTWLPVRASIRLATARLSAPSPTPIAKRAAEAEPGAANATRKVASANRLMPVPL